MNKPKQGGDKLKRCCDVILASSILLILTPILLITCCLVLLVLGRPVLYKQKRPGLNAKPFTIYKFRTMSNKTNSAGELLDDEYRLTKFGRWLRRLSIDELPQLINVIKGDLSLVGPRPLLMEYLPYYSDYQARRHEVRPGITGWAQVNGRNSLSWEKKFELDVWYVDNKSMRLDIKILFLTLLRIFKNKEVNHVGCATMPLFLGNVDKDKGETFE